MESTERQLAVGFLGAGYIADWHAAALRTVPRARLAAVCDRDEGRARAFAARHGIARVYASLGEMLSEGGLDSIHVLLPPELHASTAGEIIGAGLDVLLEKPMAIAIDECDRLVEQARSAGVKLGVGHNFLFAPIYERLKQDLAAGRLGRLDEVTITWNKGLGQLVSGPFNLWMLREPQNIILEVGSHSVAHMIDLIGPAKLVAAQASNPLDLPGGPKFFRRWRVEAETGSVGVTLNFSFAPGFSEHAIHVRGSFGAATVDFERNTYLLHRHTAAGLDFDRYQMTVSEANQLKVQARSTIARAIYSKLRPIGGGPYGQSIARAMQSFYVDSCSSLDVRICPEFGREVVRGCIEIGQQKGDDPPWSRPGSGTNGKESRPGVTACASSGVRPEVLLLGVTGFIGQELARQFLDGGHSIRVLVRNPGRLPADLKDPRVDVVVGDLARSSGLATALQGIRCVYHLARPNVKTWEEWVEHEINATRRVAEACLAAKVGRLIYTGTIDSYFGGAKAGTITEDTPLDPHMRWRNYYARAKALSEQSLMELHGQQGLPVVIFRPGIVIGRGGNPLHWGVGMWSFDAVCQFWGRGCTPLPLVLVQDVASALVAALDVSGIEGESFNLVAESKLTAREYLDALERCAGVELQKIATPLWKFYSADVARWLVKQAIRHPDRRLPSYRDLDSRTQRGHYDCSKARKILGWRPTSAREGIIQKGVMEPVAEFIGGAASVVEVPSGSFAISALSSTPR
jgi:predicted dehydrogenase/nucleoside-diphosphate-sugar epimerase